MASPACSSAFPRRARPAGRRPAPRPRPCAEPQARSTGKPPRSPARAAGPSAGAGHISALEPPTTRRPRPIP